MKIFLDTAGIDEIRTAARRAQRVDYDAGRAPSSDAFAAAALCSLGDGRGTDRLLRSWGPRMERRRHAFGGIDRGRHGG